MEMQLIRLSICHKENKSCAEFAEISKLDTMLESHNHYSLSKTCADVPKTLKQNISLYQIR